MPDIAGLEDEQDDPVDGGDKSVQRERSMEVGVNYPNPVTMMRGGESVNDTGDNDEQPGDDSEDFISDEGFVAKFGALGERIIYKVRLESRKLKEL